MSKIFCGISEVPKGQKRGSQEECYNMGQVRYYGKKKISKNLLKQQKLSYRTHKKSLLMEIAKNKGKIRKLRMDIERYTNPDKKKEFKIELNKIIKDNNLLIREYKKLEEDKEKEDKNKSKKGNDDKKKSKKSKKEDKKTTKKSKKTKQSRQRGGTRRSSKYILSKN